MIEFGLVLFVFLFLVTFDFMFKYISRFYLENQSIKQPMGMLAIFAPLPIILLSVLYVTFFLFVGFIGKEVLHNKIIENIGGAVESLVLNLMVFFMLTAFFYLLLYIKSFFAIYSSSLKEKKKQNKKINNPKYPQR